MDEGAPHAVSWTLKLFEMPGLMLIVIGGAEARTPFPFAFGEGTGGMYGFVGEHCPSYWVIEKTSFPGTAGMANETETPLPAGTGFRAALTTPAV